jgi:hypothetical protein
LTKDVDREAQLINEGIGEEELYHILRQLLKN